MMKTLDEVIEQFEKQMEKGQAKILCVGTLDSIPDALHYLREYRKLDSLDAVAFPEDDNPAMTWDELHEMIGKPVWVEDSFDNGEWYIIECFTAANRFIAHDRWGDTTLFNKKDMGDVWQAYRKERG